MKNLTLAILTFVLAACATGPKPFQHTPDPGPVKPLSARELDVIETLLRSEYHASIAKQVPLVIDETPSIGSIFMPGSDRGHEQELLENNPGHVPREVVRSFLAANATEVRLGPELGQRINLVFFSRADGEKIFVGRRGWKRFYKIFPDSPGCISVSRVGFSHDGQLALVYLGSQSYDLAGGGRLYLLRRTGGHWVVTPARIGNEWIS